ncbi:MAG: hypothetical protein OXH63_02670, partial [Gemmatimonadetes bacterium]|nr:hypothetical protein [Gemmatimonadota bacterium]
MKNIIFYCKPMVSPLIVMLVLCALPSISYGSSDDGPYRHDPDKDFARGGPWLSFMGLWSDGYTMWVVDFRFEEIHAYNLSTKDRQPDKDFNTLDAAGNNSPTGLWSDGITMWVADSQDDKIYAYNLSTKDRQPDKDFNTLDAAGNNSPTGLWSDGITMWVADDEDYKLYAYNLSIKDRQPDKDFNTLRAAGNRSPRGLWSDGITMWVADDNEIYAFKMPKPAKPDLVVQFPTVISPAAGASFTLSATVQNLGTVQSPATTLQFYYSSDATISTSDTEVGAHAVSSLAASESSDHSIDLTAPSGFGVHYYGACVASVSEEYITSNNCSAAVAVFLDREPDRDFDTLDAAGNNSPTALWSDGTTMWVADDEDYKLYAYNLSTKARQPDKDFNTLRGDDRPTGLWSDGNTMWVIDYHDDLALFFSERDRGYLRAYNLSTKARQPESFNTLREAGNQSPRGLWSDGITMWVADDEDDKLYAYNLITKARPHHKDLNTPG